MRSIKRLRPSPAMLVATVALLSGLGGSAVASSLITGKNIAANAITSRHVRNGSLQLSDLSRTVRVAMASRSGGKPATAVAGTPGDRGPAGPQGPQGPQGQRGQQGAKGDTGQRGPAGADGWSCKDPSGHVKAECAGGSGSSSSASAGETLLATVTADGRLDHGKEVKAITHAKAGDYLVSFDVGGLDRCTNVATIVGTQQGDDGSTTILVSPANVTNTIHVQTFADTVHPTATDKPFNLAAFCQ